MIIDIGNRANVFVRDSGSLEHQVRHRHRAVDGAAFLPGQIDALQGTFRGTELLLIPRVIGRIDIFEVNRPHAMQ